MLDAEQCGYAGVSSGLGSEPGAGVYQNNRKVTVGGTCGHVAGVFLMPGRVCNDELAFCGGKIAVGHIYGDALLPLCLKAVHQECQVQIARHSALAGRLSLERLQLIFIDEF